MKQLHIIRKEEEEESQRTKCHPIRDTNNELWLFCPFAILPPGSFFSWFVCMVKEPGVNQPGG